MYMLGYALITEPGSGELYLSFHYQVVQNIKISQEWELRAFLGHFPTFWLANCFAPTGIHDSDIHNVDNFL